MEMIIKVSLLAIIGALLASFVRQYNVPVAIVVSIAAAGAVIFLIAPQIKALFDFFNLLISSAGLERSTVLPVFKVIAVAICVKITSQICKDCNQGALAANVEICGAVCGVICAMPLLQEALRMISKIG